MNKEKPLSVKIIPFAYKRKGNEIPLEDFKEAVKRLKEEILMYDMGEVLESEILEDINKIFGDLGK